jgi:hypothetical protein
MSNDRADRASQVAGERRRRTELSGAPKLKLAVPEDVRARLEADGLTPRWVNDTGSRIADLTIRDDYDRVEGVEPIKVDDIGPDGKPVFAYLLAKRNDFIAEDRAKAEKVRKETETARFGSKDKQAQPNNGQMGAATYVDPATKIGRANQIIE